MPRVKEKKVKAWVVVTHKGNIKKIETYSGCCGTDYQGYSIHKSKMEAFYNEETHEREGDIIVPCTITYSLTPRK